MTLAIRGVFWLLSLAPDGLAILLSRGIARLLVGFNARGAQVAKTNFTHCFPELGDRTQKEMVLDTLTSSTLLLFELAYLQHRPIQKMLNKLISVEGEDKLKSAWQADGGVILLMPHFGCWEFLSAYLGRTYPISALYAPPKVAALEDSITATRQRQGAKMHPTTASGLRSLMRGLRSGDLVVLLPDQVPEGSAGRVDAPFFGRRALTMSLAQRLIRVGSPKVLMAAAWRDINQGQLCYRVCFEEPDQDIYSRDEVVHATALNAGIEAIAQRDLTQYQWTYKRFRGFDDEIDAIYRRQ
jgi:KDO2-lipid IV(A) lauroyltransferase